ncbi:hypothetical protein PENSPDRAFT_566413, partial [Peniophora sp. CONT]
TPRWRKEGCDCVSITTDDKARGIDSVTAARVRLLFTVKVGNRSIPCALVRWFSRTGMWVVKPDVLPNNKPAYQVVHLDTSCRLAHLLPVFGPDRVHLDIIAFDTLDWFRSFHSHKYADH